MGPFLGDGVVVGVRVVVVVRVGIVVGVGVGVVVGVVGVGGVVVVVVVVVGGVAVVVVVGVVTMTHSEIRAVCEALLDSLIRRGLLVVGEPATRKEISRWPTNESMDLINTEPDGESLKLEAMARERWSALRAKPKRIATSRKPASKPAAGRSRTR